MSQLKELYPVKSKVTHVTRMEALGQVSQLIWFTGLSGSGKSTLAVQLESLLFEKGYKTYLLDGDTIRTGLNHDLGFSEEDRAGNEDGRSGRRANSHFSCAGTKQCGTEGKEASALIPQCGSVNADGAILLLCGALPMQRLHPILF